MEYYFIKSFTLKQLRQIPNIKVVYSPTNGNAFVHDKCDNYVRIKDVLSETSPINTVIGDTFGGDIFLLHDIALGLQIPFFSEATYSDLLDYLDENELELNELPTEVLKSYIALDFPNYFLQFTTNGNGILAYNKSECEGWRYECQAVRAEYIADGTIKEKNEENSLIEVLVSKYTKKDIEVVSSVVKSV